MTRWTAGALARAGADHLESRGFEAARLESDLLLAHVLGLERLELYTSFDMPVDDDARGRFRALVKRRLAHEPIAYILGRRDFLEWTFEVGPGVLIPRPETEHVVAAGETFLEAKEASRFVELGVGSGCIAVSLLARAPGSRGVAYDVSEVALDCARRNAERIGVSDRLELERRDLREILADPPADLVGADLLISNPPYIRPDEAPSLAPDVRDWEPAEALFCDEGALAHHRRVVESCSGIIAADGGVVLELPGEGGVELVRLAGERHPARPSAALPDYAGLDRVFVIGGTSGMPVGFAGLHGAS